MNKGSALIIVTLTVMIVALFTVTALYLSNVGRDLTARYKDYSSAYEMAVAGNDYVWLIFSDVLENAEPPEPAEPVVSLSDISDAFTDALKDNGFIESAGDFTLKWNAEIETDMTEEFEAETAVTLMPAGDEISVTTEVYKYLDGDKSFPVTVQLVIYFDGSERPVLKSKRL